MRTSSRHGQALGLKVTPPPITLTKHTLSHTHHVNHILHVHAHAHIQQTRPGPRLKGLPCLWSHRPKHTLSHTHTYTHTYTHRVNDILHVHAHAHIQQTRPGPRFKSPPTACGTAVGCGSRSALPAHHAAHRGACNYTHTIMGKHKARVLCVCVRMCACVSTRVCVCVCVRVCTAAGYSSRSAIPAHHTAH